MQNSWRLQGKGGIAEGGISLLENSWFCIGISRGKSLILAVWHTHTHSLSGVLPGGGSQRTPAAEQRKNWPQTRWRAAFVVVAGGCEERKRPSTQPAEIVVSKDEGSSEGRNDPWKGGRLLGLGVQVEFIHTIRFLRVFFFWRKISLWRVSRKGFFPSLLLLKFLLHIPH